MREKMLHKYEKLCIGCNKIKIVDLDDRENSDYYLRTRPVSGARGSNGLHPDHPCKDCRRKRQAKLRKRPGYSAKQEEYRKKWRKENRKHIRTYQRSYWREHFGKGEKYRVPEEPIMVSIRPFAEWLHTFLRLSADILDITESTGGRPIQIQKRYRAGTIAKAAGLDRKYVEDLLRGKRLSNKIDLGAIDQVLVFCGQEHMLCILYPLESKSGE